MKGDGTASNSETPVTASFARTPAFYVLAGVASLMSVAGLLLIVGGVRMRARIQDRVDRIDAYFVKGFCTINRVMHNQTEVSKWHSNTHYMACTDRYQYKFTSEFTGGQALHDSALESFERPCRAACDVCSSAQVDGTLQLGTKVQCWKAINPDDLPEHLLCPNRDCIMVLEPGGKLASDLPMTLVMIGVCFIVAFFAAACYLAHMKVRDADEQLPTPLL